MRLALTISSLVASSATAFLFAAPTAPKLVGLRAVEGQDEGSEGASIRISYCTGCRWMLRATYFSQEILSTFDDGSVSAVTLVPQFTKPGGDFSVEVDDVVVWDRRRDGGFPQIPELKRRIRDIIDPDRDLGHSDAKPPAS